MTPEDIFAKPIEQINSEIEQRIKLELKINPSKVLANEFYKLRKSLVDAHYECINKTLVVATKLFNIVKTNLDFTDDSIIEPDARTFKPFLSKNGNHCKFKLEFVIGNVGYINFHNCFAIDVIYYLNTNSLRLSFCKYVFDVDALDKNTEDVCNIVRNSLIDQITRSFQE
jgi:hypothetical protein